jgi:hypothetical protein
MLRKKCALWFEFVIGPPANADVAMVDATARVIAIFVKIFMCFCFLTHGRKQALDRRVETRTMRKLIKMVILI